MDEASQTRVCSACRGVKPLDQFSKDRRRKSGVAGKCQICKNGQDWRTKVNKIPLPERKWSEPEFSVLSLGAGVQSTTVLMLVEYGILPKLDCAIFADTGWEPQAVYDHLAWLKRTVKKTPIHHVSAGNLRQDILSGSFIHIPVFFRHEDGKVGMMHRQCTKDYKIRPIRKKVTELYGSHAKIDQWIGISLDESSRMKDSGVLHIKNQFPLVDMGWTREDCVAWLNELGIDPPRSACVGCPFQSKARWEDIRSDPILWADVLEVDRFIRPNGFFLHGSARPLEDWGETQATMELECDGYCGV